MRLRRHSERQVILDDLIESERGYLRQEIEDWSNYPEKFCAQRELSAILTDALTRLSPRLSAAFYLRNVEDLSVKETAERLGVSTNGAKSRVSRARSRLRKKLWGVLLTSGQFLLRQKKLEMGTFAVTADQSNPPAVSIQNLGDDR